MLHTTCAKSCIVRGQHDFLVLCWEVKYLNEPTYFVRVYLICKAWDTGVSHRSEHTHVHFMKFTWWSTITNVWPINNVRPLPIVSVLYVLLKICHASPYVTV